MTNFKKITAFGAVLSLVAVGSLAFAQDDLDDLLKDLEGETAEAPAAQVKVEGEGEEAKAEAPAAEAAPAEEAKEEATEESAEAAPAEEVKGEATEEATGEVVDVESLAEDAKPTSEDAKPTLSDAKPASPDAELLANIRATEELRRKAFDEQAKREILDARAAMEEMEYSEAARHYGIALKLLNDRPASKKLRRECEQGVAEGLYRAAMQEDRTGRRDRAIKLMEKAIDMRHPKARKQLEFWLADKERGEEKLEVSSITHRRNDEDFKEQRKADMKLLKRARQLLAVRDIEGALEQCEIVLKAEPYNEEAIRLRKQIIKKQQFIVENEHMVARDGMIAEVGKKWRPVYAPNARKLGEVTATTDKKPLGNDPERSVEQNIIKRMKDMRLPTISFKPPATIIDAVEFFRGASKDYDNPEIPLERRGFNMVLKTPEVLTSTVGTDAGDDDDSFSATADDEAESSGQAGVPVIPMITASDVTFYEALKLVCDSVNYKFKVQGKIILVMQKDMTTDEMVTRSYPVLGSFIERMGGATSDLKEMKQAGFGGASAKKDDGEENQEKDWKAFFEMMGVQWPEGSTIMYIKTIGKLRVKNTYENLAELEKALTEMNADPKLIEIEARFVEVCQEDLNSLGFEWILNSDLSLNVSKHLARALNLKGGKWGQTSGTTTQTIEATDSTDTLNGSTIQNSQYVINNSTQSTYSKVSGGAGSSWSRSYTANRNVGINAFGGDSGYTTGMRYLSTDSNHISGESSSTNDQLVRMNAFLGGADLSMILHMLSQRSDTDLLSAPKVLTSPGSQAVIKVVTEYIYPTDYDVQLQSSSSSSSSSSGGSQSAVLAVVEPQSFTMREVGVILDVTPTLTDDGNLINLELKTQVVDEPTWKNYGMKIPFTGNSSLQSFEGIGDILTVIPETLSALGTSLSDTVKAAFAQTTVDAATTAITSLTASTSDNMTYYEAPMEQPFFHVRSIDSTVSVYPGATIVMGGLITEQRKAMDDKIPFLGDLPFIGRLFRSHSEQTSKRNLLIFVTTRLVDTRGREVALGDQDQKDDEVKAAPEEE